MDKTSFHQCQDGFSKRRGKSSDRQGIRINYSSDDKQFLSQIKSMSTLPSNNYTYNTSSKISIPESLRNKYSKNNSNQGIHPIKQLKIKKTSHPNKKHGYIYKSTSYLPPPDNRNEVQEQEMRKLQNQNVQLRSRLLDCQLRQRENIEKINKLQMLNIKLEELIARRKTMSREEQKFLAAIKSTFSKCFGLEDYKQIWQMQKQILQDWMNLKISQRHGQSNRKSTMQSNRANSSHTNRNRTIHLKLPKNPKKLKIKTEEDPSPSSPTPSSSSQNQ